MVEYVGMAMFLGRHEAILKLYTYEVPRWKKTEQASSIRRGRPILPDSSSSMTAILSYFNRAQFFIPQSSK